MNGNFLDCLQATLIEEGGWSNVVGDTGGPTMAGVTQKTYDAWRRKNLLPVQSVAHSTKQEREEIYFDGYWVTVNGGTLPVGADMAVFDASVNSGPSRAIALQAKAGRPSDTINFVHAYTSARLSFLHAIRNGAAWKQFGRGWGARCGRIEAKAIALATKQRMSQAVVLKLTAENAADDAEVVKRRTRTATATSAAGVATVGVVGTKSDQVTPTQTVAVTAGSGALALGVALAGALTSRMFAARAAAVRDFVGGIGAG